MAGGTAPRSPTPSSRPGIDRIITSPSLRCAMPAEYLSQLLHLPMTTDKRIMEMNFGTWEGLTYTKLWAQDPAYRRWMENWKTARCPGGESFSDVMARVQDFLGGLGALGAPGTPEAPGARSATKDESILLFTHAGVIRIVRHLLGAVSLDEAFQQKVENMLLYQHRPLGGKSGHPFCYSNNA